jgi:hypothetical protein
MSLLNKDTSKEDPVCDEDSHFDCNICLETLWNRDAIQPCECPYFRVHAACLPDMEYVCMRCRYVYARVPRPPLVPVATRCSSATRRRTRCIREALSGKIFCTLHDTMAQRGRQVMVFLS